MRTPDLLLAAVLVAALHPASATAAGRRPADLVATTPSGTEVVLQWRDTNAGRAGYSIERRTSVRERFVHLSTTAPGLESWLDGGLTPGTTYRYRVRALGGGAAGRGARVVVRTPGASGDPPVPPVADVQAARAAAVGVPVTLSAAGSHDPDGTVVGYAWDLGDGTVGSGVAVSHAYAAPGTYVVTLIVTDDDGLQDVAAVAVAVEQPVSAVPWGRRGGGAASEGGQAVAVGADGGITVAAYATGAADFGTGVLPAIGTTDLVLVRYSTAAGPLWTRRWGGDEETFPQAVAVGADGSVVVAGYFTGTTNLGGAALVGAGARDIFVAKYSAAGTPLWSRRFGAANDDVAYGVAVDAAGDVLVGGFFRGTVDFGGGAFTSVSNGLDCFVLKLAGSDGAHRWSRKFVNNSADIVYALAVDGAGNPVVTGSYLGRVDVGCGAHTAAGGHDAFVAKLAAATGACVWSGSFGSTNTDRGQAVAVDGAGDVVVAGFFTFTVDFGTGPLASAGGNDAFLLKLAGATGASRWARRFGGSSIDVAYGVAAQQDGGVAVAGFFQGAVDFGGGALSSAGVEDAFVAAFDTAGAPRWSTRFGGASSEQVFGAAVGPTGDVAVTGFFQGSTTFAGAPLASAGQQDLFVLTLAR